MNKDETTMKIWLWMRMRRRFIMSASTPPTGDRSSIGIPDATVTTPSTVAEPVIS